MPHTLWGHPLPRWICSIWPQVANRQKFSCVCPCLANKLIKIERQSRFACDWIKKKTKKKTQNPQKSRLVRCQAFFQGLSCPRGGALKAGGLKDPNHILLSFFCFIIYFCAAPFWGVCHFCGLARTFISSAHCCWPRPWPLPPEECALFDLRQQAKQH